MKKILLLSTLLVTGYNLFAFTTQANWRWRNDDGTETTATWKATQNTPITLTSTDIFRLRLEIYNNTGGPVGLLDTLQYATSTAGPWTDLDTAAGSNDFQIAGTSAFVTQGEPTTAQLVGVALTFVPGQIMVDSMVLKQALPDQRRSEFEWTIKATANTKFNTVYYFREWGSTANKLDIGMTYPSLLTSATLPVNISSFNVSPDKNSVLITWTTVTEKNNSYFDIERSADGKIYSKIATVQGSGTTSLLHSYSTYDDKPLNGTNYYRIKQFDVDGKYQISDVRSLKMALQNYVLKVFPNPSHGDITFTLNNYNGNSVTATLNNVSGKTVYQQVMQINGSDNYKLNLQNKLAPGVYFLQLKGDGLSENIKVVIQ